jgi:hypothetical protein
LTKFKLKGTPYLKGWLTINVLKTLLDENSTRNSVDQQVGAFSAVECNLFRACKVATAAECDTRLNKVLILRSEQERHV